MPLLVSHCTVPCTLACRLIIRQAKGKFIFLHSPTAIEKYVLVLPSKIPTEKIIVCEGLDEFDISARCWYVIGSDQS